MFIRYMIAGILIYVSYDILFHVFGCRFYSWRNRKNSKYKCKIWDCKYCTYCKVSKWFEDTNDDS